MNGEQPPTDLRGSELLRPTKIQFHSYDTLQKMIHPYLIRDILYRLACLRVHDEAEDET